MEQNLEVIDGQFTIYDGVISDFGSLPQNLGMKPRPENNPTNEIQIELGPLEFDYSKVKQEVLEGKSRLRLIKDGKGSVLGFTVISPGEQSSDIKMLWVNPQYRKMALGEKLLQDAVQILPQGVVSMDIWGGEPMIKLATKLGFSQNPGGNMTNRYSFQKKS